jgi:hypothetical protein
MSVDLEDDEFRALLSAYSAGTLTEAERKRLFEKALGNQGLFDQLLDEETMRAAMADPFVKRSLDQAARRAGVTVMAAAPEAVRQPSRWLYVGLAACLAVATVGLYSWLGPRQAGVEVAQAPVKAPEVSGGAPSGSVVGEAKEKSAEAKPRPAGRTIGGTVASPVASPVANPVATTAANTASTAKRLEAPAIADARQAESAAPSPIPSAPPPPPAARPSAAAEASAPEPRARNESASTGPVPARPDAPPESVAVTADGLVRSIRDSKGEESAKAVEFRSGRSAMMSAAPPRFLLDKRRLTVAAPQVGQLYVFAQAGERVVKIPGLAPYEITAASARQFTIPDGFEGTLLVWLAPQRDAQLDRFTDGETLPVRMWTRFDLR